MPCEKHGPRASVTTKTSAFGLGFCLLSPSGHVFHTARETMIKSYTQDPKPCISFLQEGEAPPQQATRAKVPRSCKGLEDGCWPKRSSSLPTSHRAYPRTTRHCDMVRHSQACHHCGADCTLGGEHGRSLWEEETPVQESTQGMWRQRMGLSSDAHRGWLLWLYWSNNNLIPDQAWTNKQGQTEGHTAASNSNGKGIQLDLVQSQKEHHSMTKSPSFLSPSLPTPHPTPTPPFPHPLPPSPHHLHPYPLECIQSIPQHLLSPVTSPGGWSCWRLAAETT